MQTIPIRDTIPTRESPALLRTSLLGNAVFSGTCGAVLLLANGTIGAWLGLSLGPLVQLLGLGLLIFAVAVAVLGTRPTPSTRWVRVVIAADASWVVGSMILIASPLAASLTERSVWLLLLLAKCVFFWAVLQSIGLRMASGSTRSFSVQTT